VEQVEPALRTYRKQCLPRYAMGAWKTWSVAVVARYQDGIGRSPDASLLAGTVSVSEVLKWGYLVDGMLGYVRTRAEACACYRKI
jgi:hypothetical protein